MVAFQRCWANRAIKGIPHGLRLDHDKLQSFLYHANNVQRVTKKTIDGQVI
jgi:hypothetical protein